MKKIAILSILLAFFCATTQAQTNSADITDKFFEIFAEEPLKAFDYAFGTNPYLENEKLAIETLKTKFEIAVNPSGSYLGFEKITEKDIVNRYKVCSFLLLYEKTPIRFTFIMYRAKDTWCVNQLFYDSNFEIELQTSAKQDHI